MAETREKLTPNQRRRGQARYVWFARLNGASIACLADNMLILFALSVGLRESLVGVLASFLHITMPFMLLGKGLVARFGAVRSIGTMWLGRNLCGIGIAASPLIALFASPRWVPVSVMFFAFMFCTFRAMGMVGLNPLIADISDENSQGRMAARNFFNFTVANLITMSLLVGLMQTGDGTRMFQGIIFFGALLGVASALVIFGVPESSSIRESAAAPIGRAVLEVLRLRRLRQLLLAHIGGFALLTFLPPMSMAAVKKGYGIADSDALFLVLVQLVGGVASSFLSRTISERSGPRPLMLLGGSILASTAVLWTVAPQDFNLPFVFCIFFLTGFGMLMMILALTHCFIALTPPELRLSGSLIINLGAGAGAGIAGFGVASGIVGLLKVPFGFSGLELYDMYFRLTIPIALVCIVMLAQVERMSDWHVGQVMGVLFSPRDLRALFTLSRMEDFSGPGDDRRALKSLEQSTSPISESSILDMLDSPDFIIRARAIGALRRLVSLGDEARAALIRELRENQYTTAYLAAEVIGENNVQEAVEELMECIVSDDVYLAGKSMVALARLKVDRAKAVIEDVAQSTGNPRLIIHAAAALAEYGDTKFAPALFRKSLEPDLPDTVRTELLYVVGRIANCGDEVYRFLRKWRQFPEQATLLTNEFIEESSIPLSAGGDTASLRAICRESDQRHLWIVDHCLAGCAEIDIVEPQLSCLWIIASQGTGDNPQMIEQ